MRREFVEIALTPSEAKALARIAKAGISEIRSDRGPVTNEATVRRATDAAERGLEKLKSAIAAQGIFL